MNLGIIINIKIILAENVNKKAVHPVARLLLIKAALTWAEIKMAYGKDSC